jgi:hypothetical protein
MSAPFSSLRGRAALLTVHVLLGLAADARAQPNVSQKVAGERLMAKIIALSRVRVLSTEAVTRTLGVRLGPVKQVTPYRSSRPIVPDALIAGGHILKMGKHTNVEIRPRAGLKLTFENVAGAFLDVPYTMDVSRAHVADPDSTGTRIAEVTHEFLVPAGVVRVSFVPPRSDEPGRDALVLKEASETADGKRNPPIDAVTVSDNLYRYRGGWAWPHSLRTRRLTRGESAGR